MKKIFFLFIVLMLGLGIVSKVHAYEGYEAGRQWGKDQGITDTNYNSDDTSAFAEGVRQAAKEQQQGQDQGM
jgi:hypothetical protein